MKKLIIILATILMLLGTTASGGGRVAQEQYWTDPSTNVQWVRLVNLTNYRIFCQVLDYAYSPPQHLDRFYIAGGGAGNWVPTEYIPQTARWNCYVS